jgi:hypothetical protein
MEGCEPVNLFDFASKYFKFLQLPIDEGIDPKRLRLAAKLRKICLIARASSSSNSKEAFTKLPVMSLYVTTNISSR